MMSAHDAGEDIIGYAVLKERKKMHKEMIQLEYTNDSLHSDKLIQRNLCKLLKTPSPSLLLT